MSIWGEKEEKRKEVINQKAFIRKQKQRTSEYLKSLGDVGLVKKANFKMFVLISPRDPSFLKIWHTISYICEIKTNYCSNSVVYFL